MRKNSKKLYTDNHISVLICALIFFSLTLTGCEAFRKKFVRKPKKEKEIKVVIHTHEYESLYSVEQSYKKYFLFWRASHEELVNSLNAGNGNRKKRVFAAEKVLENLQQMRKLLLPEKQAGLDRFILEQKALAGELDKYKLKRARMSRVKAILEKQRRQIQREFSYKHTKEYLIKE